MRDYNQAIIVGRVADRPEARNTTSGENIANFRVATGGKFADPVTGEQRGYDTEWHNVVAFGKRADIALDRLGKGSLVFVEGRLSTRSWQDKESGKKMYRTEIVADKIIPMQSTTPKPEDGIPADIDVPF